jgi:hypothetical protein
MDETVDKIEKDSKLLYKKYASIHGRRGRDRMVV